METAEFWLAAAWLMILVGGSAFLRERDRQRNSLSHEYRETSNRHNKLYFEVQDLEMKVRRLEEQLDLERQIRKLGEDLELERRVRALEDSAGD